MLEDEKLKEDFKILTNPEEGEWFETAGKPSYDDVMKEVSKQIMDKVKESDLFDYFRIKGLESDFAEFKLYELLKNTHNDVEMIEKVIPYITPRYIADLILSTDSPEYVKKCLENEALNIPDNQYLKLLRATKDPEYILDKVKKRGSLEGIDLEFILEVGSVSFMKECIREDTLSTSDKYTIIEEVKKKEGNDLFVKELLELS